MTAGFQIVGVTALQRIMGRRVKRLRDRRTVNARAVAAVDRWVQDNFTRQGRLAHDGDPWAPLAASTLRQRRQGKKSDLGARILVDRGTLKQRWKKSWTAKNARLAAGVDYAIYHHKGTKKMARRKLLPTQKQIGPLLKKVYRHFIKTNLEA